jgi:hypothetical protein
MRAWEQKHMLTTTLMHKAVHTAEYNLNRKKGKRALDLWKRGGAKHYLDKEERQKIIKLQNDAVEREKRGNRDWIRKIYEANGMEIAKSDGKL